MADEARLLSGRARTKNFNEAKEKTFLAQKYSSKAVFNLACMCALLGETDEALDVLEKCHTDGTLPDLAHLQADEDLDSLRDSPRFQALLAKLKE